MPDKSPTDAEVRRMAKLRKQFPWFVRPQSGALHVVSFGDRHQSNGIAYGAMLGFRLNVPQKDAPAITAFALRENGLGANVHKMLVFPNNRIVDILPKAGALERKGPIELWDPEPPLAPA
jgi:hypothetical protein